jgi:hypothetical protein
MYLPISGTNEGITIAAAQIPAWVLSDPICITAWIHPTTTAFRNAFGIEGLFYIRNSGSGTTMRIVNSDTPDEFTLSSLSGHQANEWRLVTAYWNPATGYAMCIVTSPSANTIADDTDGDFEIGTTRNVKIGARIDSNWSGTTSFIGGMAGGLGPIVIRRNVLPVQADNVAMFNSKRIMAPLTYDGGNFGGTDDEMFAFNLAVASAPVADGVSIVYGSVLGSEIVNGNYAYLIKGETDGQNDIATEVYRVRPITSVINSPIFGDHRTLTPNFFEMEPGVIGTASDGVVGNVDLCARMGRGLPPAHGGVAKIAVWSNSRGIRRTRAYEPPAGFGYGQWYRNPGSHALGFAAALLDRDPQLCIGIVGAYLRSSSGGGNSTNRQFIFDGVGGPYTSGTVSVLGAGWHDFRRFTTGSASNDNGSGDAVRVMPDSVYTLKAMHEPDTPCTKDVPLVIRMHYLRFPGGCNFDWANAEAASQNSNGTLEGPSGSVSDCDTEQLAHTYGAGDSYNAGTRTLTISGENGIEQGWVGFISSGTGAGSVAEVEGVTVSVGETIITLRHAFENAPASGSVIRFGPWSIGTVQYTAPATSEDYRGPRITTDSSGNGPAVLLFYDAWVEGAAGYAFAPWGWGGNGYAPQRAAGFTDMPGRLCAALGLDAVFLHGAFQSSDPEDMESFAQNIAALSNAQPVYLSDQNHWPSDGSVRTYAEFMEGQALFPASIATEAEGSYFDQVALGLKADRAHPNIQGMASLAGNHLDLWASEFSIEWPTFNASNICVTLANDGGSLRPAIRFDVAGDAVELRTSYGEGTAGSTRLDVLGLDSGGSVLPDPQGKSIDISTTMTIGELLEEIAGVTSVQNIQLATGISLDDLAQSVLGDDSVSWESVDDVVGYAFSTVECVIGGGGAAILNLLVMDIL